MCNNEKNDCGCIYDILKKILLLQKQEYDSDFSNCCDKPFLGPTYNVICYNTRPIILYNCETGDPWKFTYTIDKTICYSNIFRIEALNDCCCTCRILYTNSQGKIEPTNEFFTINTKCIGAIKCLPDVSLDIC